jgi:hypothetical protein
MNLPDRAKGGTGAKRPRLLWGMPPQCAAPAVVLPPLCSGQARGPPQGRVRGRRDATSAAGGSGRYREEALLRDSS